MSATFHIGTSGRHYDHRRRCLEHYARSFSTVELNNIFYRLPSEKP